MIFKKRERKENKKNIGGDYSFRTNQHMPPLEKKNVKGVQDTTKKSFSSLELAIRAARKQLMC